MVFMAWILLELWSYQSMYVREVLEPSMPSGLSSTFFAYMSAAVISGLPFSSEASSSVELLPVLSYVVSNVCLDWASLTSAFRPNAWSLSSRWPLALSLAGRAAAITARCTEAYSLAEENAARARVRLIMSGLLVACAMSCERLSSEEISWLYRSTVLRLGASLA